MFLQLTDLSDEPLQRQIVRQIRAKILTGELQPGAVLPSIRKLARDNHVSVITVDRAYKSLEYAGLIHSRPRKGFIVSEVTEHERKRMVKERIQETLQPLIESAVAEGFAENEIIEIIQDVFRDFFLTGQRKNKDGKDISIQRDYKNLS